MLLLDANISWRLTVKLELHFKSCLHVDNIGIAIPAKDTEIWNYALANNFIIITNDTDFLHLSASKGFPPKNSFAKNGKSK